MDKLNLDICVKQVTYNSDSTIPINLEENEELALGEVVDPNTEFMCKVDEKNESSVSPRESYGLTCVPENSIQTTTVNSVLQTLAIHPLVFQIEAAISGDVESKFKLVSKDSKTIPQVHAYGSTHLKEAFQTMECNVPVSGTTTRTESQNQLCKYPSERIIVLTEGRHHLSNGSVVKEDELKTSAIDRHMSNIDSSLTMTSSNESVATLGRDYAPEQRRDSMYSTKSMNSMSCGLDQSTTTDQLMWALRTARDRLDTASNISGCSSHFELDSNCSERIESGSTISDVSGYEEEMYRIRRLLLLDSPSSSIDKHNFKFVDCGIEQNVKPKSLFDLSDNTKKLDLSQGESEILQTHKLGVQLQTALVEKEKYKVELAKLETKLSLEWQEKYNEILRQKAHTEGRLEIVQAELEAFRSERQCVLDHAKAVENEVRTRSDSKRQVLLQEIEKLTVDYNTLQQQARELEVQKEELHHQLEMKDSQINHWKEEVQNYETCNEKLRIELQELKVEMESKDGAIQGLKEKITNQHVEYQLVCQAKIKADNNLTSTKNELDYVRKSGEWYRDQLHVCQAAKLKVQQEQMACQTTLVSLRHVVEKFKCENTHLQQSMKDTQQRAVKEKELLMKKLEAIQADMMEREAAILGQIHREDVAAETFTSITAQLRKLEEEKQNRADIENISCKELEEQVQTLTRDLNSKNTYIKSIEVENAQLMMRVTTLQKTLNEKELLLQGIDGKFKQLEMAYNQASDILKSKEQSLLDIKNEKFSLQVSLAAAETEKIEVESAVSQLREDFFRISEGYYSMKSEIRNKDKQIQDLEMEVCKHVKLKQSQCTELMGLKKTEEEYKSWKSKIQYIEKMEQEIIILTKKNNDLKEEILQVEMARNDFHDKSSKLGEQLAVREQQLMSKSQDFDMYCEEQKTQYQMVLDENNSLIEVNEKLKLRMEEVESQNTDFQNQLESLKKQVSSADGVIEQFNSLCRDSEKEKHLLDEKLKRVMKELKEVQLKSELETIVEDCTATNIKEVALEHSLDKPNVHQVLPADKTCLQANLCAVQELIEQNLKKITQLISNKCITLSKLKVQSGTTCINIEEEFVATLSLMNEFLDEALEERKLCLSEIENSVKEREKLLSEVTTLRNGSVKIHLLEKGTQTNLVPSVLKECIINPSIEVLEMNVSKRNSDQLLSSQKEIDKLKSLLKMTEVEQCEKHRRYERNIRTLLKKVKEHMRGRKIAERSLEALRAKVDNDGMSDMVSLQLEVKKLESEVNAYRGQFEEQKRIAEKSQLNLLELEKERGKLVQSQDVLKEHRALTSNLEVQETSISKQLDQQTRDLQLQQTQKRITDLEQEASNQSMTIRELKKQVFAEKCENSHLRKQLASVRMGLNGANDMLDNKNIEAGRNETWRQLLLRKHSDVQKVLEMEQKAHKECREAYEKVKMELEESHAKDPILVDQIKTLSYHLHQKSQEASSVQEKILLTEERWLTIERGLQQNVCTLQDEVASLRSELDTVGRNKLIFQTQAAELRAALHSSLEQNKMLKLKVEAYSCDSNKDQLPDLTSSLPLPTKYDEAQIAELLHQSAVLPSNKPLSNLQSCLDSLKQEMATLQMQLTAKTSGYSMPVTESVVTNYNIQNI